MRVSIEWFLLDNMLLNAAVLLLAAAWSGVRVRKLLGAALCLACAVYALLSLSVLPVLAYAPLRILPGGLLALGLRFEGWRAYLRGCACVLLSALLLGGLLLGLTYMETGAPTVAGYANGIWVGTIRTRVALLCVPLVCLLPRFLRRIRSVARVRALHVEVRFRLDKRVYCVRALLDTGNLLTEPVTGLPVMLYRACPHFSGGYPVPFESMGAAGEVLARRVQDAAVKLDGLWRPIDIMVAPAALTQTETAILGSLALPVEQSIYEAAYSKHKEEVKGA